MEFTDIEPSKSRSTKRTKKVLVINQVAGEGSTHLRSGMIQYIRERGGVQIDFRRDDEAARLVEIFPFTDYDGIISEVFNREIALKLKDKGLPIVDLSGEMIDDSGFISADFDLVKIAELAAERFIERGFTNFAYYGLVGNQVSKDLLSAFTARLAKEGLKCNAFLFDRKDRKRYEESYRRFYEWLSSLPRKTAVLCLSDWLASDMLNRSLAIGKAVPDDIAIIGIGNDATICTSTPIPISSIDPNRRALGYAAMRIIESAITHPVMPKRRPVFRVPPLGIVERESTAIYPVNPPWLAKALSLLDANTGQPPSVEDLAKAAGVSQPTLQSAIQDAFGMSAAKYITTSKMRKAEMLVSEGKLSIKEIAFKLGFSSPSYFSRVFREFFGRTPRGGLPQGE